MSRYDQQLAGVDRETREAIGKAKAITAKAAAEGRGCTPEEKAELDTHLKAVEVLAARKAEIEAAIEVNNRIDAIGDSIVIEPAAAKSDEEKRTRALSVGEAFVKSAEYQGLRDRGMKGRWSTGEIDIQGKALLDSGAVGSESGGLIQADVQPGILPTLTQQPTIADLMAQGTASSPLIRYMQETVATNGAAGVPESGEKPESALEFDATDVSVKKIATFLPVTDEMMEDVPALQSYINSRLTLFVKQEEDRQLLEGAGGDEIDGLLGQIPGPNQDVTNDTVDAPQAADHIYRAITTIRKAFVEPDAIVMHPDDWESVQLLKDDLGRYLGSGPYTAAQGPSLWGKPVVVTTAVDAGTALVGAFRSCSQIYRRGGLSVEASNSHADYFQHNKTAIRCEERLALAVYRPEAFCTAALNPGS